MAERWECCGRGTRLLVCMVCGARAPVLAAAGEAARRVSRADVLADWHDRGLRPRSGVVLTDRAPRRDTAHRCEGCGLPLVDELSRERGYGPTCWRRHAAAGGDDGADLA